MTSELEGDRVPGPAQPDPIAYGRVPGLAQPDSIADGRVRIFDTTLRDGEQAPGCTMTLEEKLAVAHQLARLRVDVIEGGFPAASPGDWNAVHQIAREVGGAGGPAICGLARASERDIERCWQAVEPAVSGRIHIFLATSDLHMKHKLGMTRAQIVAAAANSVAYACSLGADVEFSAEDAARSDPDFLYEVLTAALECGATTLNVPDTVGYSTPDEYGALVAGVLANVPGVEHVTVSAHCHDDLGLAVANSLAALRAGARQAECTINGIGERAGNAALEELVMALHTRRPFFGLYTNIDTRELARSSRLVSDCTGIVVPPNKAIVGANAFAHEAGIHQDGVLKNRLTYEIMTAESVGWDGIGLVLGKHSGRHALRAKTESLGYALSDDELSVVFARFKDLADKKKLVDEGDIRGLLGSLQFDTLSIR
ncbi:MAG TPA: 2-isopropylmalate synthase [Gemmatimonadaceae bacterium]|nr:2-isopropylmalate synthase [Gemmatimonadaceae bacterium]